MNKYTIKELTHTNKGITYGSSLEEVLAVVTTFINNTSILVENVSTNNTYLLTCTKVDPNEF